MKTPEPEPQSILRMPAEWRPHEATWIAWPHNASDWPKKFAPIPWVYGEIARKIIPGEVLRIIVNSTKHAAAAKAVLSRCGADLSRVEFFSIPTNRAWTRDFGPIFVWKTEPEGTAKQKAEGRKQKAATLLRKTEPNLEGAEMAIMGFRFTGWAKYRDWALDNKVPQLAARALGCPLVPAGFKGTTLVLEGGSIDVNGAGALIATEECLLDRSVQPRNPELSREDLEQALDACLGASQVIWLGKGIAGDDTHGHIDDVCRFTGPRTVVLCQENNPHDTNYPPLQENRERLEGVRLNDGSRLEVVPLPMPSPLFFDGQRLPASYANFYITNSTVLVPTFNDPQDRIALGILAELFPGRAVVGIHAVDLVWGLGAIHCLTQQQPLSDTLHIYSGVREQGKRRQKPAMLR
jgi:agmatine deiminase